MGKFQKSMVIPGVLTLSAHVSVSQVAFAAQPSLSNMQYFVQDPLASGQVPADTSPSSGTGVIGEVKSENESTPPVGDEDENTINPQQVEDEEDDPNSSDAIRTRRSQSVEVFADYSTFVTDQEDFSPVAYGVKYYQFLDSDFKIGGSIAYEQFQLNDDESDVIVTAAPGERVRERNIDIEGSAIRFAVHGQYFVENSMNAQISIFGATGETEKEGPNDSQYYGRSGLSLSLGNQWSWESFTLSWNWLSLTYNFNAKIGGTNLLTKYPSNRSGGMILLSGLGIGAEW